MLGALLPVFIQTIQVIGQPSRADLQESQFQFWKAHRQTLANDVGKVEQQTNGESVRGHFRESRQVGCADLVRIAARTMDADYRAQSLCFGIYGIIKGTPKTNWQ